MNNWVVRDFQTNKLSIKCLTNLTEFHMPAGKVYLFPILDCFDELLVSCIIEISPDVELVNTMLDDVIG